MTVPSTACHQHKYELKEHYVITFTWSVFCLKGTWTGLSLLWENSNCTLISSQHHVVTGWMKNMDFFRTHLRPRRGPDDSRINPRGVVNYLHIIWHSASNKTSFTICCLIRGHLNIWQSWALPPTRPRPSLWARYRPVALPMTWLHRRSSSLHCPPQTGARLHGYCSHHAVSFSYQSGVCTKCEWQGYINV
jgi:hypothetical protein